MSASEYAEKVAQADPQQIARATAFIEAQLGTKLEAPFAEALRSGEVLCRVANAVRPGAVSPAPRSADRTVSQVPPEGPADDRAGLVMADAASPSNGLFVPLSGRPPP